MRARVPVLVLAAFVDARRLILKPWSIALCTAVASSNAFGALGCARFTDICVVFEPAAGASLDTLIAYGIALLGTSALDTNIVAMVATRGPHDSVMRTVENGFFSSRAV